MAVGTEERVQLLIVGHPCLELGARRAQIGGAFHGCCRRPCAFAPAAHERIHHDVARHVHGERCAYDVEHLVELRASRATLATTLTLLRAWTLRFGVPWLAAQAYFRPYPVELAWR